MKKILILSLVCMIVVSPASSQNLLKLGMLGKAVVDNVVDRKGKNVRIKKDNKTKDNVNTNKNGDMTIANNNDDMTIANNNDEIALTVSADGATKEEATKIALRSAIEQAYGAFVSANTTILNDDLVKDEIVTITNGNIKGYEEVASALLLNGRTTVTLKTVVCISKLVSYAQSKGATTEFTGATFAMNMKIKELNKKNEMIALNNLLKQVKALLPMAYDRKLTVREPFIPSKSEYKINYDDYLFNAKNKSVREQNPDYYNREKQKIENWKKSLDNSYMLTLSLQYMPNDNTKSFIDFINSSLESICLKRGGLNSEYDEYERLGLEVTTFRLDLSRLLLYDNRHMTTSKDFCFRNTGTEMRDFVDEFRNIFFSEFTDFQIVDNTGVVSSLNELQESSIGVGLFIEGWMDGTGLFNFVFLPPCNVRLYRYSNDHDKTYTLEFCTLGRSDMTYNINVVIPKDDISKYSSFKVERKNK